MARKEMKPAGRAIIIFLCACLLGVAYILAKNLGAFNAPVQESTEVEASVQLPDEAISNGPSTPSPVVAGTSQQREARPVSEASLGRQLREGPEIRLVTIPWQAVRSLIFANGGPSTVEGSLMAQQGVRNLSITRQDDMARHTEGIIACATEMHRNNSNDCTSGYHFMSFMGDASAYFIEALNSNLAELGPEYMVEVVGSTGFSRGEDRFMGPQRVVDDPQQARGLVVSAFVMDGDWNIAMEWADRNNIPNNPDVTTYDPNALNWVNAEDFMAAVRHYNTRYCEVRDVVENGRRTGEERRVCVEAIGTWTPGDVATLSTEPGGRGGLVNIASTADYANQMPNALLGIRRWMSSHSELVDGMLAATMQGADAIKGNDAAFRRSGDILAVVYDQHDGAWWNQYFHEQRVIDPMGTADTSDDVEVLLGGSYVNNWLDNQQLFGLNGGPSIFEITYRRFGEIASQQYPDDLSSFQPWSEVSNTSYLVRAAERLDIAQAQPIAQVNFAAASPQARVVSARSYDITFRTGSATFTSAAEAELRSVLDSAAIASSLSVEVHGHTDNTGDFNRNMTLSEERAFAVSQWLTRQAPALFPEGRVRVHAHGQTQPMASNSTTEGRAQNRRVEIVLRMATAGR